MLTCKLQKAEQRHPHSCSCITPHTPLLPDCRIGLPDPADIFTRSSFSRVYYLSRPNGTITCDKAEALCKGLWPQGAWQQVSYSFKAQQLEVEQYFRAQTPALAE
jgi:hypothetical protein